MTNTSRGLIITIIGVFIMSFESLLIKLTSIDSIAFSFYIGLCMFISMLFMLFKEKNRLKKIKVSALKYMLFAGLLMALANLFFIAAIKNTLASNVVLIIATSPLFSALIAFLFYKTKPQKNIYIASFFIFVGLFVIFGSHLDSGNLLGNIYAVICTVLFSSFFVFLSHHKNLNRVVILCLTGLELAIIAYFLADNLQIDNTSLIYILIMGLLVTPISRLMITNGTKYINASEVSLLMIIETVMAPIWVWMILKEVPSLSTFYGGIIIILTLVLNSLYLLKKSKELN